MSQISELNETVKVQIADQSVELPVITGSEQARRMNPAVSGPGSQGAGYTTTIVPLRYISATNMAEILRPRFRSVNG